MTESSLFSNCTPSQFLAESGMKSFKIIKESSRQRKLIGYFATWDQVSKCISTPQLWNDVNLSWCHYSSPRLGFKKHPPVRIGNTGNTFRCSKPPHPNTNKQFSDNHRCHNQNKKENTSSKSGSAHKKNSRSKSNQSNRPNVKHLVAGLKALLEQFI
ncbi:hypothetical protein RclHR1_16950004 [Rhizophagus clarus]|uniref:Uncharacterized protein n=1 Tax=Rhizophagus clarus TaxID=94130 RepID=A0A2Z6RBH4_9GLOM|nr:hypothetical protein RclHR1_16950004 [Rhizophagus clarus]GET00496.1 hypothetical protein GLOIN_2v1776609 [Rhizophagus clarus]